MMPRFVPTSEAKEQGDSAEAKDKGDVSDIQKAKDAAEIQKYETERIESQKQAVFAENEIKDTEDL